MTDIKPINIDFTRAAMLLDIVQKVATTAPGYMALSSAAMIELKKMNDTADAFHIELGKQRLADEQAEAAARTKAAQDQADADAAAQGDLAPKLKPIQVVPGQPNELAEIKAREESVDSRSESAGDMTTDTAPILRRTAIPDANDPSRQGSG